MIVFLFKAPIVFTTELKKYPWKKSFVNCFHILSPSVSFISYLLSYHMNKKKDHKHCGILWSIIFIMMDKFHGFTVNDRSSRSEVFYGKAVLKNFEKISGKHLCQIPFFG